MRYCRIDLSKTNYELSRNAFHDWEIDAEFLQSIYKKYCDYKGFKSVMPIFNSEFFDPKNDVIVYTDEWISAFSLIRRYDSENVEAIQFAWDYDDPSVELGLESLRHECAYYKSLGYKYLYLGQVEEYKKRFDGYEEI